MNNEKSSPPPKSTIKHGLIYRLRKKGFMIATRQKTIYCEYMNTPDGVVQCDRLRKEFDFKVQFEIR